MKLSLITLLITAAFAFQAPANTENADNTANNARDKSGETVTPTDQSNDEADIKITAEIRKAVVEDDSLSLLAKNVKIVTVEGGAVVLRGPVESEQEKATIEKHAKDSGASSVTNEIEVKAD